jgi:hypothetical protein
VELALKFTVNLAKSKKNLALRLPLLVEGNECIEKKKQFPGVRHTLIMPSSGRPVADIRTMAQAEGVLRNQNRL